MRAVTIQEFGTPGTVSEVPDPVPGPGEIVLDIKAAPVNYVDLLVTAGTYQFKAELPFTPGKGPAGVVSAVGAGVCDFHVGDRVLAMTEYGGYAEKAVAPARQCYRLPPSMSFQDAATMGVAFDTAWFGLCERGRFVEGETVLILGASGAVGNAAIQLVKALKGRALAGMSNPQKSKLALAAGADAIIDLSRPNLQESLREQVFAVTSNRGVDIVLDPIGGDAFEAALRAVAWRGRVVVIGFASGAIPTINTNYLMLKNIEVSGMQISDYRRNLPEQLATCFERLFALYDAKKIRAPAVTAFPLERYADALQAVRDRTAQGRIILIPGGI